MAVFMTERQLKYTKKESSLVGFSGCKANLKVTKMVVDGVC